MNISENEAWQQKNQACKELKPSLIFTTALNIAFIFIS